MAALLFAQFASAGHVESEDAHPAGDICAICVVQAHLDSADVAAPMVFAVAVQPVEPVAYGNYLERGRSPRFPLARGPPHVS